MENSFFYACFMFIAVKLRELYRVSRCAGVVNWFNRTFGSIWFGSRVRNILCGEYGGDRYLKNSAVGRILDGLLGLFKHTAKIPWESSTLVLLVRAIGKDFMYMNTNVFGVFLTAFVVFNRLTCWSTGFLEIALVIVLAAIGLICLILRRSLAVLLRPSFLAKQVCAFFDYDIASLKPETIDKQNYMIGALFFGAAFGAASYFLGTLLAFFTAIAFFGVAITLYKTEAGIFAAAFLIPLLPTMLVLGIVAATVISFLIKLVFGGLKIELKIMDFFVITFVFLLVYSLFISYIPSNSLFMVLCYVLFILFFFAVKNTIITRQKLFALITLIIISAFGVALIGIFQKYFGINIDIESWIDAEMFEDNLQRVYSTLGNPNVLGEYLILTIPIAFGALYYFDGFFKKAAMGGMLIVMACCMLFTSSRGAWLGLIAAMAVFFALRDRRFIWIGLIGLVFLIPLIPQSILDRFMSIGDTTDSSTSYRVSIWQSSVKLLLDFWPIGIGLGTNVFMFVFQRYAYSAAYAQHSHNLFLQIMIDNGIIGFVVFIAFIYLFFKNLLSGYSTVKDNFIKTFSAALTAGMAGYLVQSMTDNTWYNYRIVVFFWLIMALSSVVKRVRIND